MIDQRLFDKLFNRLDVCFLSSVDGDGYPNTKAMLMPRKRDGLHTLWFSTNTSSLRTAQFRVNPKACVYFCDRSSFQGLMLTGKIEVLINQQYKDMLWEEGDERYYPLGVTDPDYCTLRFTAEKARYYNGNNTAAFEIEPPSFNA